MPVSVESVSQALQKERNKLGVSIVPHKLFRLFNPPSLPCPGARSSCAFYTVDICADHVAPEMRPYQVRHEWAELLAVWKPKVKERFKQRAPIYSDSCHNLANAEVYRLAACKGQLETVHAEWFTGEPAQAETEDSRNYRERLYQHYKSQGYRDPLYKLSS